MTKNKFLIKESAKKHSIDKMTLTHYLKKGLKKDERMLIWVTVLTNSGTPCTIYDIAGLPRKHTILLFTKSTWNELLKQLESVTIGIEPTAFVRFLHTNHTTYPFDSFHYKSQRRA